MGSADRSLESHSFRGSTVNNHSTYAKQLRTAATPPAGLPTHAAAEYIGVARQTLANWRVRGDGPPYAKLGKSGMKIVYRVIDLDQYLADHVTS
jgi:hypothetical protein